MRSLYPPYRSILIRWHLFAPLLAGFTGLEPLSAKADDAALIAVVGPASGAAADTTAAIERGVRRAVGGYAGKGATLQIESVDDGCEPRKAEAAAETLVARKMVVVIGHPCTGAALAAAKVYAAANIVFIATETRHPDLTAKRAGPTIFRLAGNDAEQGEAAAAALAAQAAGKPVAVVHDRTLYAKTIAEAAIKELRRSKIEPITATIIAGDKEYAKLLAKIKGAGAVLFAGFPLEAGFIASSLRRAGSSARLLCSDSIATDEFASSFAAEAKNAWVLQPNRQDSAKAAEAAVEIVVHALELTAAQPGTATGAQIAGAIAAHEHATVLGPISFSKQGDAGLASYKAVRWDGAAWVPVSAAGR